MHTYDSINAAKKQSLELAAIYRDWAKSCGSETIAARAARVSACSDLWTGYRCPDCGRLHGMVSYGCRDRLCAICAAKLARATAAQALQAMAVMQLDESLQGCSGGRLTLTVRNVSAADLPGTIDKMLHHWALLRRMRPVARIMRAWARNIEITYNKVRHTYHPHIHCIVALTDAGMCELSQTHPEPGSGVPQQPAMQWAAWWRQAANLDYTPVCDIRPLASTDAVYEVSKYAAKPSSIFDSALSFGIKKKVVRPIAEAIFGRRLKSYGGAWLKARRALNMKPVEELDENELSVAADGLEHQCACGSSLPLVAVVLQWSGLSYDLHTVTTIATE